MDGSEGVGGGQGSASTSAGGHPEQGPASPICEGPLSGFVGLTVSAATTHLCCCMEAAVDDV